MIISFYENLYTGLEGRILYMGKFQGTTEPQQKLQQGLKLGGDIAAGWVHC